MIRMNAEDLVELVQDMAGKLAKEIAAKETAKLKADYESTCQWLREDIESKGKVIEQLKNTKTYVILEQLKAIYRAGVEWCDNWNHVPEEMMQTESSKLYRAIKNCPDPDQAK